MIKKKTAARRGPSASHLSNAILKIKYALILGLQYPKVCVDQPLGGIELFTTAGKDVIAFIVRSKSFSRDIKENNIYEII